MKILPNNVRILWPAIILVLAVSAICLQLAEREPEKVRSRRSDSEKPQSGHDRMLGLLQQIAKDRPAKNVIYSLNAHAPVWRQQLKSLERAEIAERVSRSERWQLLMQLGHAETCLGNVAAGIDHLLAAEQLLPDLAPTGGDAGDQATKKTETWMALGVAYMRLGEDQNCCLQHNAESCILPIQGGGLHTNQEGSRNAIKYFLKVVNQPKTEQTVLVQQASRWLLNIAYMTVGGYPEQVPEAHRLPTETFQSEIEFPRFENVAPKLNLDTFNLCGGAIVDDFDNDDYLDIVTCTWDVAGQMQFFRNNRDGTFSDRTKEAGLSGLFGGLNMVQADYNNDGNVDVLVLRGAWFSEWGQHPNSLLRNNGNGTFTDVTFDAGLGAVHYPTKTASWADYDNDGDVDLFIANETTERMHAPFQLFRNNGDGTFTDVAAQAGIVQTGFAMGTVWGDYNNDRYPDIYVAVGRPACLFRNNRDGTFTDVAQELGVLGPDSPFPTWFWDFNNDGALDLFASASSGPIGVLALNPLGVDRLASDPKLRALQTSTPVEVMHLYQNDGSGGFTEVAKEQNLTYPAQPMGANFGDLDNDGFLDFYLATGDIFLHEIRPNVMFLNQRGKGFVNVTMAGGFGHLQKGHAVCFADIDNDGDQDVYIQMGGAYAADEFNDALFENPGFGNRWLTIKLEGRQSNRSGIGARIHATILEDGKERSVYRHVNSGGSFGCNPLRQTIGLGKADRLVRLEIFWPTTGRTQVFEDVPMDQIIWVVEDQADYEKITLKQLKLGGSPEIKGGTLIPKLRGVQRFF
jgi:hypothetical protein